MMAFFDIICLEKSHVGSAQKVLDTCYEQCDYNISRFYL